MSILYCMTCQASRDFDDETAPDPCHTCQGVEWRHAWDPKVPYKLTRNDRRFLHSGHIDPEVPDDERPKLRIESTRP